MRALNFGTYGRTRPAGIAVRTAVPCILLIRMRSQVQVLAGPPPIVAGHSAVGSEPGAPAASLGRAGAARPSPPARPLALPGPSTRASGPTTTTHRGRPHPSPRAAATRPLRPPRAAACSRAHGAAVSDGAPYAGQPCLVPSGQARPPPSPNPARVRHRPPTDQCATPAASSASGPARPSTEPLHGVTPTGTSTVPVVQVARRTDLVHNATARGGMRRTRPDRRGRTAAG
jgi:hypothetical protein